MSLVCDNLDCEGSPLSIIEYEGGVWFVGAQITSRLGYRKSSTVLRQHCPKKVLLTTRELKESGVPSKGSKHTYIIPFMEAVRLVMKCDNAQADHFRMTFLFIVMPYIFYYHPDMFGGSCDNEDVFKRLLSSLAGAMRNKDIDTGTRIVGEFQIKQVGK